MIIEKMIKESKLVGKMNWDMDCFHESANAIPFAVYTTPTKAYKLCISERAIWANEIPIAKASLDKTHVDIFLHMLEASLSRFETLEKIQIDWKNL